MRIIKKTEFVPWQKYEFDHTFMYQGFLLLLSSVCSTACYSLLIYVFLTCGDHVFDSYISDGGITTSITGPVFWTAIAAAGIVAALFLFADLLRTAFRRWLTADEADIQRASALSARKIIRRTRNMMILQFMFYTFIYLLWLYASTVFSLVFRNGMVRYSVIFICLTFLTFFGKKLFCFPVYVVMKKAQNKEKLRRSESYLSLRTEEGGRKTDITTKRLSADRYPLIFKAVNDAVGILHAGTSEIKVVMGDKISVRRPFPRKLSVTIGVSALAMLSEDELSAKIRFEAMKLKNSCLDSINRFIGLNKAIAFSSSSWNPLERVYKPFEMLVLGELALVPYMLVAASENYLAEYVKKVGEDAERLTMAAEIKLWVYSKHEFAYDREFFSSILGAKHPVPDYHKRLMRRYWQYLSENADRILHRFADITDNAPLLYPYNNARISTAAKKKLLDIERRPHGQYLDEVKHLSNDFDKAFVLCARINYRNHRKRIYLDPTERIRRFEHDRISGVFKSDAEICAVANDYITIMMPQSAISLAEELANKDSADAKAVMGRAKLRMGDPSGFSLLLEAGAEEPKYAHFASIHISDAMPLLLSDDEQSEVRKTVKRQLMAYKLSKVSGSKLWYLDDLTGQYKLSAECKPSRLQETQKKQLADTVIDMCRDRLEWAALVCYESKGKQKEVLVVRCSKLTSGAYTDSYLDGVYLDNIDLLARSVRLIGDFGNIPVVSDFYPEAPLEAFEQLEGAVICHKGKLAAQKFLKDEAKRHEKDLLDTDFDGFEDETGPEE